MTVKRDLATVLLCNGNERIKSLMYMVLMTVHTEDFNALCIRNSYRLVIGKVTIALYKQKAFIGVEVSHIVKFMFTVTQMYKCISVKIVLDHRI